MSCLGSMAAADGCGQSPTSDTGSAGESGSGSAAGAPAAGRGASGPTFTQVYTILSQNCAGGGCHISSTGAAGLSMASQTAAYTALVGASSTQCRGQQRVVAGKPEASVLMNALEHTTPSGCRVPAMPERRPMLAQSALDTISMWIVDGAPNN